LFPEKIVKDKNNVFSGEREIGTKIEDFSNDHINRYNFAKYFIRANDTVLDAACGVGYGSHLLADRASSVDAIDYNDDAIKYAKEHWQRDNIRYIQGNLLDETAYPKGREYHVIVSFETIEHLKEDDRFLRLVSERLLTNGMFFVSAPNANIINVKDNPWHERHYTPEEFVALEESREGVLFIDVRTEQETANGALKDARLIPLEKLEGLTGALPKDNKIYIHFRQELHK